MVIEVSTSRFTLTECCLHVSIVLAFPNRSIAVAFPTAGSQGTLGNPGYGLEGLEGLEGLPADEFLLDLNAPSLNITPID